MTLKGRATSPVSLRVPTCRDEAISGWGDGDFTLTLPHPDLRLSGEGTPFEGEEFHARLCA
ncbi:MAG: hypothetical protein V3T04_01160 [Dehalococcoidia bacterium]